MPRMKVLEVIEPTLNKRICSRAKAHLCDRVVDDHAQLGMKMNLERIAAHNNHFGNGVDGPGLAHPARPGIRASCPAPDYGPVTRAQLCCNRSVIAMRLHPYLTIFFAYLAQQFPEICAQRWTFAPPKVGFFRSTHGRPASRIFCNSCKRIGRGATP